MQLAVLNENLGTVRADLVTTTTQLAEFTRLADELKGEKLGRLDLLTSALSYKHNRSLVTLPPKETSQIFLCHIQWSI